MNITAEQIITDLTVKNYELEAVIKELKIRNQELREKNELLEEKHWDECRQIALYDDELRKAKCADAEQPEEPEKPKKTYKEDYFERFQNAGHWENGTPAVCRSLVYDVEPSCDKRCTDCWNEVMPDAID